MGTGRSSPRRVVTACLLCETSDVPLSEDEQRILSEIEEQLYESDPDLVREVTSKTIYSHAFRNLRFAALLFVFLDFQFDIAAWPLSTLLIAASCLTLAVLFRSRLDYCSHISGRFF